MIYQLNRKAWYATLSNYVETKLFHDLISGHSVTCIHHLISQYLIERYLKNKPPWNDNI